MLVGGGRRTLSEYIYSIVSVAAAIGIACAVAPEGTGGGIKKHMKLLCALCFLCVLIGPLTSVLDNLKNAFGELGGYTADEESEIREKYERIYNEYLEGGYGENVEEAVKALLTARFGMPEGDVRATVKFADKNGDGINEVEKITVILSGKAVFVDPASIKACIGETFDAECVCAIE